MVQKGFIDVGERFRPTGEGPFGRRQAVWRVINSFEGTDGMAYAHAIRGAELLPTQGLGHRKLLKDAEVLGKVANFTA